MNENIYDRLGVRRWVNAGGYLTRLGGNIVSENVLKAMEEAARSFVDIGELQAAASKAIAKHTGADAGLVTSGASAALTLAAAASIARYDPVKMALLPNTQSMPCQIIMPRPHRNSYDHALRLAGATIVEFGFDDAASGAGARRPELWEAEALICDQTIAFGFLASPHNLADLEALAELAARYDLPVIVDAAPYLPPVLNLRAFIDSGASLVAFSGGKALGGPQGSGILCGDVDLIASAALQHMDMTILPASWTAPDGLIPEGKVTQIPRHGIGRGMKVSKEEIVGLIVALEQFVAADQGAESQIQYDLLDFIRTELAETPELNAVLLSAADTGRRPLLELHAGEEASCKTMAELSRLLRTEKPPIEVTEGVGEQAAITIDPAGLNHGDAVTIAAAIKRNVTDNRTGGMA